MNKQLTVGLLLAAAALVLTGAACSKKTATTTNTSASVNAATNTAPAANRTNSANTNVAAVNPTASAKTIAVSASPSGFSPSSITISAGDTVTWTNTGSSSITVAPDNHPSHTKYAGTWDDDGTGRMSAGASYSKTFTAPGTYTYHDHINAQTTGTVTVK